MKTYKVKCSGDFLWQWYRPSFMIVTFLFLIHGVQGQTLPQVSSSVDSTQIRIGEQIHFKVEVEADTTNQVVFPEGQTFSPLELVEASSVDTIAILDKFNLIKKYTLTQFDSGSYTLPQQKVLIDDKPYFTDSLLIEVGTVAVDTTQQKMFDIKPLIAVERHYESWIKYGIFGLVALVVLGGLLYWFVLRKKPLTASEKEALLPPYDRALLALKKLDESRHLIQSEYKIYYSQLTEIVRSYLEEGAQISALESTTNELIVKLEMLRDAGDLDIDETTIKQFGNVLQAADLVKFAKSQPETKVAEDHRKLMEKVVIDIKDGLPELSEEALLMDETYLATLRQQKKKKRIIISSIGAVVLIAAVSTGLTLHYGFNHIKDTVLGHPTKELLEGEWIMSEYGYPPVYIETPRVLKRTELPVLGEEATTLQAFAYGNLIDNFYVLLSSTAYKTDAAPDMQKIIDASLARMEALGAKNIIVKQENISTPTGKTGVKVFGSMNREKDHSETLEKGEYVLLCFMENGSIQQLIMVYESNDTYAQKIVDRIMNSIDFKAGT